MGTCYTELVNVSQSIREKAVLSMSAMMTVAIYAMVYLGSALMVWNIVRYARYARRMEQTVDWRQGRATLYIPVMLLVFFLLGYLGIGLFGRPDMLVAGILFGGSIFVFIVFVLLERITDRIQMSERLEAELMAAEQSNQVKSSFLSSVSHEMRTPMNAIIGLDVIALANPDLDDDVRRQLEQIGESAQHLEGLIDDMLDMSTMESGRMELHEEPFRLGELLNQIDAMIAPQCSIKGLEYSSSITEDADGWYLGDANKLRRAMLNILQNAVKFTAAPGTVTFAVTKLVGGGDKPTLLLSASDTGIGIDEEFLPSLFDAFAQEDVTTTSRYGGSGLGLSIAKQIVDSMDGSIDVTSRKGEGSTFVVSVSLATCEPAEQDARLAAGAKTDGLVELGGAHILVVDDIDMNAEIMADLLDLEGATCDHAENGQVAVDMFAQSPVGSYDAILMDLRMPVMDGFESARCIRALHRPDAQTVPIIALTANASEDDRVRSLEAGMDNHLPKPVDVDTVYYWLRVFMTKKARGAHDQV